MNKKVFVQLLVYASVFALFTMPQAMGKQECYGDKEIFKHKCRNSIAHDNIIFVRPSDSCCKTARKVNMACVCRTITPEEEHKINTRYVFNVAHDCNNPVPPGEKCGSWTVPPPPPPPHHMQHKVLREELHHFDTVGTNLQVVAAVRKSHVIFIVVVLVDAGVEAEEKRWRLQGHWPQPLSLPTTSAAAAARPSKRPRISDGGPGPVIIYEHTPQAVRVRPDEFMAVVQRLTGQQQPDRLQTETAAPPVMSSTLLEEETVTTADAVVLTLVETKAPPVDYLAAVLPSPGPGSAGFLLSPGIVLLSPATLQAIHELIS
ncbi:hypothetical protein EJB05_14994 [Eragrostis curvula]|uniref:VQ domain-containing protein n=1 Tax=Eragrostis curvula TaxID=38414 RepID=A0A5J9W0N6_9POAL|nr:hypothetical protein EJB05_14994 [Eragrostis curvula]